MSFLTNLLSSANSEPPSTHIESSIINVDDSINNTLDTEESEIMEDLRQELETLRNELHVVQQQNEPAATTTNRSGNSSQVLQISEVKMQAFYETDPALWFIIIESQFAARKITNEKTKFLHVVANLNCGTATQVKDVISTPYVEGHYERLKNALINAYAESGIEKFRKLISNTDMGDKKPSQFLHYMKSLADNSISDDFIRKLWIQRLPPTARAVLSASNDTLENLEKMADCMWEVSDRFSVSSIQKDDDTSTTVFNKLNAAIEKLNKRIDAFEKTSHVSRRDSTPHGNRTRSKSKNNNSKNNTKDNNNDETCWYHRKFGEKATKCRSPCNSKN